MILPSSQRCFIRRKKRKCTHATAAHLEEEEDIFFLVPDISLLWRDHRCVRLSSLSEVMHILACCQGLRLELQPATFVSLFFRTAFEWVRKYVAGLQPFSMASLDAEISRETRNDFEKDFRQRNTDY